MPWGKKDPNAPVCPRVSCMTDACRKREDEREQKNKDVKDPKNCVKAASLTEIADKKLGDMGATGILSLVARYVRDLSLETAFRRVCALISWEEMNVRARDRKPRHQVDVYNLGAFRYESVYMGIAAFYHATNSEAVGGWDDDCGFLTPDKHECGWHRNYSGIESFPFGIFQFVAEPHPYTDGN